jgi:hypothetical protein
MLELNPNFAGESSAKYIPVGDCRAGSEDGELGVKTKVLTCQVSNLEKVGEALTWHIANLANAGEVSDRTWLGLSVERSE